MKSWHLVREPFHSPRSSSAGSYTPRREWFAHSLVPPHTSAYVGSVSDHRADNETTKYPESLCLRSALPPSGRRVPPPVRTLIPSHSSYELIRRSRPALLSFGLSLVRGVSAGCYQPLLPAGPSRRCLCESFPGCLGPCHGGSAECTCLFLPPRHRPSPVRYQGRLPACSRRNDFMTDRFSRLQPFLYVQAPRFARLPDRSYRCGLSPQGSRGFAIRAEHASLPPHASDLLTIRSQAIDGVRTYTPRDSQPCRLLPRNRDFSLIRAANGCGERLGVKIVKQFVRFIPFSHLLDIVRD